METKSRYEVIAELESKKRELIKEKDTLNDTLKNKERQLKDLERRKSDTIMVVDRQIEDQKEEIVHFKETMAERKETIVELIKSMDDSLARFGELNKAKQ